MSDNKLFDAVSTLLLATPEERASCHVEMQHGFDLFGLGDKGFVVVAYAGAEEAVITYLQRAVASREARLAAR